MIKMDSAFKYVNSSPINFGEIYNVQFLIHNEVLAGNGFSLVQPNLLVLACPDLEKLNITSRDFGTTYIGVEDQIGGNLYSWIHQSFGVLWQVNTFTNEIVIYSKTCEKLGMRFATLLKMEKEIAIKCVFEMVISFAFAEISWDMFIKDNFLCNYDGNLFEGQLGLQYIFRFSKLILNNKMETYEVFTKFTKMFGNSFQDLPLQKSQILNVELDNLFKYEYGKVPTRKRNKNRWY